MAYTPASRGVRKIYTPRACGCIVFFTFVYINGKLGNRSACTSKHATKHICLSQLQQLLFSRESRFELYTDCSTLASTLAME